MILKFLILSLLFSVQVFAQVTEQKTIPELRQDLEKIEASLATTQEKMKTIGDARFLPELYFILAELQVSKARYLYNIKRLQNKGVPTEEIDFTFEKKPKLQAIETYQKILDKFPNSPDRDKALFYMAHEYRELGDLDKMITTYQKLTKDYPQSLYWSESQLIVANFIFEQKKDVDFALELYNSILVRRPDHFTPLARFKSGFAYINKALWKEALLAFEGVLTTDTSIDMSKLPDIYKKTDVRRDALIQMVWPYSELSKKDLEKLGPGKTDPLEYFKKLSNNLVSFERVLQRLGRRLIVKKRFLEATRVYFALLQISGDLDTRIEAVDSTYKAMKDSQLPWPINGYVEEVAKTINMVKFTKTLKEKDKRVTLNNFEIYARDVATRMQRRARTTKAKADFELAVLSYRDYLWAFPQNKYSLQMQLNLAETYFNMGDLLQAGLNYEIVAARTRDQAKQKNYYDSALQSYTTSLKESAKLNLLELTEARNGLRSVGHVFMQKYKNDKAIPEVMFNIGRTLYDERTFDDAVKSFEQYLARYPRDKDSALAVDLILDSYNQREDYDGLVAAGNRLLKNKSLAQPVLANISEIIKQAAFKKIQTKSGDASSSGYAKNLLQFAEKYKGSNLGEQALYEAFVTLKAKKDPEAYSPGETLLLKYGNSKYAKEVVAQMGQMALTTADFRRGSSYFEVYAQKYPQDPNAKSLLQNAAQMREFMGDYREAAKDYQTLGDREGVARNYYLASDWAALSTAAAGVSGVKGAYWQGLAQYRNGNIAASKPALQQAASSQGGTFEEKTMSAHALYLLATEALKAYQQVQMSAGKETQAVQTKNQMLQSLTQQLNQVIQYGNGRWTIAALYGLGKANTEFADFVRKAPTPSGLTGPQQQQFKNALQTQASQFEKAAEGFYKQCLSNAEKFEVFTQFVKGCQSKGREQVDEASETKLVTRASQVAPPGATSIRRKLYDEPRNIKLLIQLSQVYSQNRDYAMAQAILNRAAEVSPNTAVIFGLQGSNSLFMNDLESAFQKFQKALKINSREATSLWGLAGLYNAFGYKTKLNSTLSKARSVGTPLPPVHPFVSSVR